MVFGEGIFTSMGIIFPLNVGIFVSSNVLLGESHRRQRKMLGPIFSISHMRQLRASRPKFLKFMDAKFLSKFRPFTKLLIGFVPFYLQ